MQVDETIGFADDEDPSDGLVSDRRDEGLYLDDVLEKDGAMVEGQPKVNLSQTFLERMLYQSAPTNCCPFRTAGSLSPKILHHVELLKCAAPCHPVTAQRCCRGLCTVSLKALSTVGCHNAFHGHLCRPGLHESFAEWQRITEVSLHW